MFQEFPSPDFRTDFDQAAQHYGAGIFLSFGRISPLRSRPVPPQSVPTPRARNFRPLILGQEVPVFDQAAQYYGAGIFLSFGPVGPFDLGRQPCLLYTSPSPRDLSTSRMPSSA